ncbi:BKACE family enzyme [Spongiimicrobium salis]|uniref:3-keto-5-aminohexanoate cleavage protein n=1 Tax=Spongiimicrobium salis TaxID=1667022 RepID=UPI00374D5EDE
MKTIINFCPTGMIPTKSLNQYVPITPNEIIEQTHEAYELGITIVHLHARTDDEQPTYKKSVYREIVEGVRKNCPGLLVCCSTSGRNFPLLEHRSEVIELYPDMCSLTLSSLNFQKTASLNAPDTIMGLLDKMLAFGVHPELECFDLGMINYGKYLLKKKKIDGPCYWNLIFGNIAGFQPTFSQIGTAVQEVSEGHFIALGGIGGSQLKTNGFAIAEGLGVRVGLEDNIWYDRGRTQKASNIDLLNRIHRLMELHETELMSSEELGLYNTYHGK